MGHHHMDTVCLLFGSKMMYTMTQSVGLRIIQHAWMFERYWQPQIEALSKGRFDVPSKECI